MRECTPGQGGIKNSIHCITESIYKSSGNVTVTFISTFFFFSVILNCGYKCMYFTNVYLICWLNERCADQKNYRNLSILLSFLIYIVACQSKPRDLIMDSHLYNNLESITISFEEIKMPCILNRFSDFKALKKYLEDDHFTFN